MFTLCQKMIEKQNQNYQSRAVYTLNTHYCLNGLSNITSERVQAGSTRLWAELAVGVGTGLLMSFPQENGSGVSDTQYFCWTAPDYCTVWEGAGFHRCFAGKDFFFLSSLWSKAHSKLGQAPHCSNHLR